MVLLVVAAADPGQLATGPISLALSSSKLYLDRYSRILGARRTGSFGSLPVEEPAEGDVRLFCLTAERSKDFPREDEDDGGASSSPSGPHEFGKFRWDVSKSTSR